MIGLEDLQIEASLDFYWPKFCTWTKVRTRTNEDATLQRAT